jgi:hypothetical protein
MSERKTDFQARDRWLMFAFWVGPMAALTHLLVAYGLVPSSCAQGSKTMLHASAAAFFVVALLGAFIGWHYHDAFAASEATLREERTRWMAMVATVLSLFSAMVIIAMELPNVILRSCD